MPISVLKLPAETSRNVSPAKSPHVAKRIDWRFEFNLGINRTYLVKHLSRIPLSFCVGRLSRSFAKKSFEQIAS
jgi:hypothetical protein